MNSSSSVCPSRNLLGLGVEVVELALEDRDHVPGHVLEDLGVLERALLAVLLGLRWNRFHASARPPRVGSETDRQK